MKNRILPLSLITAQFSLFLLFFSVVTVFGQPGNSELKGTWYESVRANQNTGKVNPQDVINARRQAEALKLKSGSGAIGLNWQHAGPDNFPGMVWSAIFDNTDTSGLTCIAGSANGGVWKSIDLGLTWSAMGVDNNRVLNVSSLVQTSSGTIYAATGVTTCKVVTYSGAGIFRSVNGGAFSGLASTMVNPDFKGVSKMAISPSGRLFAATIGGLYFSDNGDEWTKAKSGYAMDVCVGSDGTVITSIDNSAYIAVGGNLDAWVTLTTGSPNALPDHGIGWMVFTVAPSDANVMYASIADSTGKLLNIYNSADKGSTWSVIFPNNATFFPFGKTAGTGCYANVITVFPNDPYTILLNGEDLWYGKKIEPTGYFNWEKVSSGSNGDLSPSFIPYYHHSCTFRPKDPKQFLIASDGGVTLGTKSSTGFSFQTSNKNLEATQFNTVAFSAQKDFVMGGGDRIGTLALGYFYPSKVSFPTNGYQVYRVDETQVSSSQQPQPSNYGGNGGTCVWSSIDPNVAVYTKFKGDSVAGSAAYQFKAIRRQDFRDIIKYNYFLNGLDTVSSAHIPMCLWETFNQGLSLGITRDSVTIHAEQFAIPADTTITALSGCNRVPFPYVTLAPIPKGGAITIADPLATRYFVYARKVSATTTTGIYMTLNMLKFDKETVYYNVFKDVTNLDPITAMTVSSDLNTLWAGTSKGRLIRVTGLVNAYDFATADVTSPQCVLVDSIFNDTPFIGRTVTSISINPNNSGLVLVTLGNTGNENYVYYTQNGNVPKPMFVSIQGNLPKTPVYTGLLEMSNTNNAIIGTDFGVFSTSNLSSGAPEWGLDILNIGDVPVTEIRQQTIRDYHILNYGVIYASSYGRGLWMESTFQQVGIDPVQGEVKIKGNLKLTPNPVQDNLTVTYTNETSGNLILAVYDITGRQLLSQSLGIQPRGTVTATVNLSSLAHGTYIVKVGNGHGKIVKQ